ncbi:sec-independent translocase [Nocardioides sp.]|uniref:sec-independent translocase n=1 Tax=Nocardioides sp. TaxID=35761 RepID=UPI0039E4C0A9
MFGVGLQELALLLVVAVVVFGPDKLPEFARQAGQFVRQLRKLADGARDQLREELGPEYADLELRDLDPRAFVRKQLNTMLEDDEADPPATPTTPPTPPASRRATGLRPGERPPYDADAT